MSRILFTVLVLAPVVTLAGGPASDLESPDPSVRRAAAERLAEAPDPAALGELIRALRREEDDGVRRSLEIALGRAGDPRAIWDLFRGLDHGDDAALFAIRTILDGRPPCELGDPEALAALSREQRESTLAWWEDRENRRRYRPGSFERPTPEEEPELLRDLRSTDERTALRAAERLDPQRLTLAELRVQAALLSRHPRSWALLGIHRPVGTVDFPTLWMSLATSDLTDADTRGRTHWAVTEQAIPVLVSLLPRANEEWFGVYLGLLNWVARDTNRHRIEAARGFAYAVLRIQRAAAGAGPPALDEVPEVQVGDGLPPAFVALVENRVEMRGKPKRERDDRRASIPPLPWLRRWAHDLVPAAADLPFLMGIAEGAEHLEDRAWAVRAMGRIADPAATEALEAIAALDTDDALFAAAELAKAGRPERFRELYAASPRDGVADMLAFEVIPGVAIRVWTERAVRPESEGDGLWALFGPGAEDDVERIELYGVGVSDETREALAAALPIGKIPVVTLAWFLTEVSASPLDGSRLDEVFARLREYAAPEAYFEQGGPIWTLLGLLEVRDRDGLVDLLHHWAENRSGGLRKLALELLGRLGDARYAPEIIEVWSEDDPFDVGDAWLGRVKDPRVREFLEARVREGGEDAFPAMTALAVWHGLPEGATFLGFEPGLEARNRLLDGDAVGALLVGLEGRENAELRFLGHVADPRAVAALKRLRGDRAHYWEATAGLAAAGETDAREELAGLFRDGRAWIFYPLVDALTFTFGRDPAWIDFWVDRVDATCCIGFSALETLGELFPTLLTRGVGCRAEVADVIRRWWARNRDRLVYSRILDGWIPSR